MTAFKRAIRLTAHTLWGKQRGDAAVNFLRDSAYELAYRVEPRGRKSASRLRELRGRFAGERCFIIGNGPSLGQMDLSLLRGQTTFGLNRGYLLFERLGFPTTFLVAMNHHVVEQFGNDIATAGTEAFLSWQSRSSVANGTAATYLLGSSGPRFSTDVAAHGVWDGGTVTYVAMQLAYYFGFTDVVLIGVDHNFPAAAGTPRALVTATADDENHFDPRYFGPGTRWQLPDLATSEIAYRIAKARFEADGRRIVDATVGGKLTVFPKMDYERAIGSRSSLQA